jgi:hypothetical protein
MPNTVFVLGAGASAEAGLPVGNKLVKRIRQKLDIRFRYVQDMVSGDPVIASAIHLELQRKSPNQSDPNPYFAVARQMSQGLQGAISIDNFIDSHRGNKAIEWIGKLAIARSILEAEKSSLIYSEINRPSDLIHMEGLDDRWFNSFWKVFTEGCNFEEVLQRARSVSFIVFNYDRCMENFIFHAAQIYYGVGQGEAAQLVAAISFYHPYGAIAPLPFMSQPNSIAYGAEVNQAQLLACAGDLKTFTEAVNHDSTTISGLRSKLALAGRVIFLGFAFHRQNVKLMWPERLLDSSKARFYGTAHGISAADNNVICAEIESLANPKGQIYEDMLCNELFHEFWRTFSML